MDWRNIEQDKQDHNVQAQSPAVPTDMGARRSKFETTLAKVPNSALTADDLAMRVLFIAGFSALYWMISDILPSLWKASSFGADSNLYLSLAQGQPQDHVLRYHPLTVVLALGWMEIHKALSLSLSPGQWLNGLFALTGALGVWAAISAFAAIIERHHALLWGLVYAVSLGVWYSSAIPESKILSCSLSAVYIAAYMHFRDRMTGPRVLLLTVIMAMACLNEIVAAFMAAIPFLDIAIRDGLVWKRFRWVVIHALPAPATLIFLETVVKKFVTGDGTLAVEASHWELFLTYVALNDHSFSSLYGFILNWFVFSLAAPTQYAVASVPLWPEYNGYFETSILNYGRHPISALFIVILSLISVSAVLALRAGLPRATLGLLAGLLAYSLARGFVFFLFIPPEALLYAPSVALPHLLILAILFAHSPFRAKTAAISALALSAFIVNLRFMTT